MMAALVPGLRTRAAARSRPRGRHRLARGGGSARPRARRRGGGAVPAAPAARPPARRRRSPLFQREVADVHRGPLRREQRGLRRDVAREDRALPGGDRPRGRRRRPRRASSYASAGRAGRGLDVVLTPPLPCVAPPARADDDERRRRLIRFTYPFNALGWPALALPCGPPRTDCPPRCSSSAARATTPGCWPSERRSKRLSPKAFPARGRCDRVTSSRRRLAVLLAVLLVGAAWSGAALAAAAPTNTAPPTISGRPQVGAILISSHGTWTDPSATFAYQWQRCDSRGGACVDIAGATGQTRVTTGADAGVTLVISVTAPNGTGSATVASRPRTSSRPSRLDPALRRPLRERRNGRRSDHPDAGGRRRRACRARLCGRARGRLSGLPVGRRPRRRRSHRHLRPGPLRGRRARLRPTGRIDGSDRRLHRPQRLGRRRKRADAAHDRARALPPDPVRDLAAVERHRLLAARKQRRVDGLPDRRLPEPRAGPGGLGHVARLPRPNLRSSATSTTPTRTTATRAGPSSSTSPSAGGTTSRRASSPGASGGGTATAALSSAIAAKGSSLGDVFTDWSWRT